jgi:hypothetical protein
MASSRTARISALLAGDLGVREVYKVQRGLKAPALRSGAVPTPTQARCWRCGAIVSQSGAGVRAPLTVSSRIRGSVRLGVRVEYLHVGCIPGDLGAPLGVPARKVRRG